MDELEPQRSLNIALVAHPERKHELVSWAVGRRADLCCHRLHATRTTGQLLERELRLAVRKFESGPLGGDQQLGASIVAGGVDLLVFFWDPLAALPHDADIRALLRVANLYNLPTACNPATADLILPGRGALAAPAAPRLHTGLLLRRVGQLSRSLPRFW